MRRKFLAFLTVAVGLLGMALTVATAADHSVQAIIRDKLDVLLTNGELYIGEGQIASLTVLPELYENKEFDLIWQNFANVRILIKEIGNISDEGLDPDDYHGGQLQQLQAQIQKSPSPDPSLRANFDILLTDALIRLVYHIVFGKVDPEALDPNWNLALEIDDRDAVAFFENLLNSEKLAKDISKLRPHVRIYEQLKHALKKYREFQAAGGWEPVEQGAALKKGMNDPRIPQLRRRLIASGDLEDTEPDSTVFDDQLEQAVTGFQKRHRLEADGVVGKQTLEALNVSVESRIDQIRVNLERDRWVFHNIKGRFIVVNIAGFFINLTDHDGEIIWNSRVQVGRPYRKTPIFKKRIQYVEFNPTWTVPPGILRRDVLPAIKRDPNYLKAANFQVIDHNGRSVNPNSIDWSKYPEQRFPYMLRQDPGPNNAVGLVKFMFPNKHLVYLHDTPSKSFFERTERAFSSGCIRVENPFELAELLLNDPDKWSRDDIMKVIESQRTRAVHLSEPIPVMLLYWTADVDENGKVMFKKDLYERDQAVLDALNAEFKFRKRPIAGRPTL